jgi:hypothetical protein
MDAYDIQLKILEAWRLLAVGVSGSSVNRQWINVPVYVEVDGELKMVDNVTTQDNKIILKIK